MGQRLLVCEYVSGGAADTGVDVDAALAAQGLAMRDALLADLAAVPGVEVAYLLGPGMPRAAHGRPLTRPAGATLVAFLRTQGECHDGVWVIAPETGGCLAALAEARDPGRWIGCRPQAIRLCSSKRATLARLHAQGIATPLAFAASAVRWVVKPDDGAGTVDTRVHPAIGDALADHAARTADGRDPTLEPWVEGEALSLSLRVRGDGGNGGNRSRAELLSVNRQRLTAAADGLLAYEGVDILALAASDRRHAALCAVAEAVAQAVPGLCGFVGIDVVWHAARGPVVIEINPRLTCAYAGLSAALGRNLAAELLALHFETAHAGA